MRLRLLIALALAGASAGCGRLDPPGPIAQPVLPAAWRAAPPGPADAGVAAMRTARWWDGFDDPVLTRAVTDALAANPGLVAASARLAAARALARSSEVAARPRIDASTRVQGERRLAGRDGSVALGPRGSSPSALGPAAGTAETDRTTIFRQAGFDASWEIDLFGRLAAERTAAEADSEAARADLAATRVTLVADVVRAVVDLRAARRQERLQAEQAALHGRLVALAARRRDAGLGTDADAERAEGVRAAAGTRLAGYAAAAEIASMRLAVLTGRTAPEAAWSEAAGPLRPPRTVPASLPADLLRDRPDVRRAEARVLSAAAQVGIAEAELLPRLSLTGSLTASANVVGNLLSGPVTVLGGGPSLTIPLLDWGVRRAVRDARVLGWTAAVEEHRLVVLDGYADAEAAIVRLGTARLGTDAATGALARADRAAAQATRRRDAGLTAEDEAIEAAAARLDAAIEEAEALRTEAVALASLFKALGTGAYPP